MVHEFDGIKYEKASAHQKAWGAKLAAELSLKGDERVLDLGCGDGANTLSLAELVPSGDVVGIDASKGMIAAARPKERPNLTFILMEIDHMDFKDEFDVVYSNAALHWVKDHQRLLSNVFRGLREGGRVRFNFAAEGNCLNFFKVIRRAMALGEFKGCFQDFQWPWYMPSVGEYQALVAENDLQDVKVWGENADRFFPDTRALVGWVDQPSLVPLLAHLAPKDKTAFREYVSMEMIAATAQDDGQCFETFRRINVAARK